MKKNLILSLLVAFVVVLASCKGGNKASLSIPKDAAIVFHINASSLSSKLTWDEIKKTEWFKEAYAESKDSFAKKLMENPEASGLDVKSDFAFFMKKRGRGGFGVFEGGVKNAAAFEALAKKMSKQEKATKDGDWHVIVAENSTVAMWNDSKFAVISDMPMGDFNPMGGGGMREKKRFGADSLKAFGKEVMTLDADESLFNDDRFASVMKEESDMHFWMNSGVFYSDMAGMLSMMKFGALLEDNVTAASINFEDGKIAARMKQYYGKEMQKVMDKWKFKNVDASVLNRIPSENVIGVMAMNMEPEGLKEFMKAIGMDGFINMALSKMEITFDEIIAATKGEFVMALTDLQMKDTTITYPANGDEKPASYTSRQPDMNVLFAASVNNKSSFDKVLSTFTRETGNMPFSYQLNNDWFVAGNKAETVNAFAKGGSIKHAFTEKISGHPFGFYLDLQRLLKTNFSQDAASKAGLAESAAFWQDVVMVANEYKNGVATSELVVNLVDKKTNSLKQLNQYIEKMKAVKKANNVAFEENEANTMVDSITTVAPPPPPAVDEH
ncbi:MAG TPA: DUF4836 family protein [Flavisolibacter sp.]|nr:DUF4836 family protein [Flavisolibacter sp.]